MSTIRPRLLALASAFCSRGIPASKGPGWRSGSIDSVPRSRVSACRRSRNPIFSPVAKVEKLCQSHFCDIRDAVALADVIKAARPEIVFHLAAQPLVRASYREPQATFATNVMGTVHVLDALAWAR